VGHDCEALLSMVQNAFNEYQEYFLGVKSGWGVRLTNLTPSWAIVT